MAEDLSGYKASWEDGEGLGSQLPPETSPLAPAYGSVQPITDPDPAVTAAAPQPAGSPPGSAPSGGTVTVRLITLDGGGNPVTSTQDVLTP